MPKRILAGVLLMALSLSLFSCGATVSQSSKLNFNDCNVLLMNAYEAQKYMTTKENTDTTSQVGFTIVKQGFVNGGNGWEYFNKAVKLSSEWRTSSVLPATKSQTPLVNIVSIVRMTANPFGLGVIIKPINAKANISYMLELYEKGRLRTSQAMTWNQPQINVGSEQTLFFALTPDEYDAYSLASLKDINWWKPIFSIQVRQ